MPEERRDELEAILSEEQVRSLQLIETLRGIRPEDLARLLVYFDPDDKIQIFEHLEKEPAAEVLNETDPTSREEILSTAKTEKLAPIIELMPPDEAADLVSGMPSERRSPLLRLTPALADEIRPLLLYDPETAGGRMTPEFVSVAHGETAGGAMLAIQGSIDAEWVNYVYVLDEHGRLAGTLSIRDLISSKPETPIEAIMTLDVISAPAEMDQEEVARLIDTYHLSAVPVVDDGGKMLGIVTVDDAIDVIQSEASEDMYQLAGTTAPHPTAQRLHRVALGRIPYLTVTLLGGLLIVFVESRFKGFLETYIAIAMFIPVIIGMAGNVGIQSSTIVVRGLATGEIQPERLLSVLWREVIVGITLGGVFGIACGGAAAILANVLELGTPLGSAVGLGMFSGLCVASLFGGLVPIACHRLKMDPAIAAGPFVTTLNDLTALSVYLWISLVVIGNP
jgi:magnesium transporter